MAETEADSDTPRPKWERVTEDTIWRIGTALEKTNGHRAHAAQILGMDVRRVHYVILHTPSLKAKWGKGDEPKVPQPGLASELHRDPLALVDPTDEEVAEAINAEHALWQKGLERLNFSEDKRNFLSAVQSQYGQHWTQMSQMFQGGISYMATELMYQANQLIQTIEDTRAHPEKYERTMENQWGTYITKQAHEVRLELTDRVLAICDMLRKLNADKEKADLIAAQIEKLKFEKTEDAKKRKKLRPTGTAPINVSNSTEQTQET